MPILMSAAFDDNLIKRIAETIGTEARAYSNAGFGGLDYWTPTINPYRDPVSLTTPERLHDNSRRVIG